MPRIVDAVQLPAGPAGIGVEQHVSSGGVSGAQRVQQHPRVAARAYHHTQLRLEQVTILQAGRPDGSTAIRRGMAAFASA